MTLRRLHPPALRHSPLQCFSLLLLGQGFTEDEFAVVAGDALRRIEADLPYAGNEGYGASFTGLVMADAGEGLALGLQRDGGRLLLGDPGEDALTAYLAALRVPVDGGRPVPGDDVWQRLGRLGPAGAMIGVLVKEAVPAELYRALGDADRQAGMVAVAVAGEHWHMPLVRGLAQIMAGLADEYELPGAEWEKAPADAASHPNVLFVTDTERSALLQGRYTRISVRGWPRQWEKPSFDAVLPFTPHTESDPNPPVPRPDGRPRLVEGAAGYRLNALRSDFDCLMRRIPAGVDTPYAAEHPVQDHVGFCPTCLRALRGSVRGDPDFDLSKARRVRLGTQRIVYDTVRWQTVKVVPLDAPPHVETVTAKGTAPHWSCAFRVDSANGLRLDTIRLDGRKDPFGHTSDILRELVFKDLAISFDDHTLPLNVADAFTNRVDPPRLEIAENTSSSTLYRLGVKLTLSWDLPGSWAVDATMSVVFRGEANDFDPGGAALACKFYPQLSLAYRRPSSRAAARSGTLPAVTALHGTVSFVANNVIPPVEGEPGHGHLAAGDASPHHQAECTCGHAPGEPCTCGHGGDVGHATNGRQAVSFFTDSNTTDLNDDNRYWLLPGGGLGTWVSGRKLAGVGTEIRHLPGTGARAGHLLAGLPGLPHWSWLFD
ncbi:MAG TPA: hypothetical protein VM759_12880, partial [Longimicrobium sp.]|nr:hypothetical protein [Longimicrobium sp.]